MTDPKPITPEQAVKFLKEHDVIVTIDQAQKILDFMNRLAPLAIEHYVE